MYRPNFHPNGFFILAALLCLAFIAVPLHAAAGGSSAVDGQKDGQVNDISDWSIKMELSAGSPAKNQEVTLSVTLVSPRGASASGIPLDIRLTSLTSPPDIRNILFLDDAAPLTDGNGNYERIFNAPYFHSHGDGHYRIDVSADTPDGILTSSGELSVVENVLRVQSIQVAHDAYPGTWYNMALYGFDRDGLSVSIGQNGVYRNRTWADHDWGVTGGMYEGGKGEGDGNAVYEVFEAVGEYSRLQRFEGDNDTLMNEYGYPAKTVVCSFLVYEVAGNNIPVSVSGRIEGEPANITFKIPSVPLRRPSVGSTYRIGEWFLKGSGGTGGTWQGDFMYIYGIGFTGNVTLEISAMGQLTARHQIYSDNYMVRYRWAVPETQQTGQNFVNFVGMDQTGTASRSGTDFYVAEKQDDRSYEKPRNIAAVLGIAAILLLLVTLPLASYSRIKRKKLLDHATRMRIYEHVEGNPGVHFRALMDELSLTTGTLSHHLNVLERGEFLRSCQDGMYRRFTLFDEKVPSKFRLSGIQERIVGVIKKHPGITQAGLSKLIGSSRIVVNYHVKILRDVDLVSVDREGRETHCFYRG